MLLSQFTTVAHASSAPLQLVTATTSTALLRAAAAGLPRRPRQQEQNRSFRLGIWTSYLDPDFQKVLHRRHRVLKHKYVQAQDRRRAWERDESSREQRWNLRSLMLSHWKGRDPRPSGRWVNMDELVRPIHDSSVLDKMMQNLVYTSKRMYRDSALGWRWPAEHLDPATAPGTKNSSHVKTDSATSLKESEYQAQSAESTSDLEWTIDPITNRKVFKERQRKKAKTADPQSTQIPVKTFKGYRSQFSSFEPPTQSESSSTIHLDGPYTTASGGGKGPEPPKEPPKAKRTESNHLSATTDSSGASSISEPVINFDGPPLGSKFDDYKPFTHNEPDGKAPETADPTEEALSEYDRKANMEWMKKAGFSPFMYNEPDGQLPEKQDSVAKGLSEYDQTTSNKWLQQEGFSPFLYNEPDGQMPEKQDAGAEGLKDYDRSPHGKWLKDPEGSSPFMYNEPDGQPPEGYDSVADALNAYDRSASGKWLNEEGSSHFTFNEPDGQLPMQSDPVQDALEDYDHGLGSRAPSTTPAAKTVTKPSLSRSHKLSSRKLATETQEQDKDIDLLRASDIRASSGIMKRSRMETEAEGHNPPAKKLTGNFVRDFPEEFHASWTTNGSINESLVPKKTDNNAPGSENLPKNIENSNQQKLENAVQTAENDYAAEAELSRSSNPSRLQTALDRRHDLSKQNTEADFDPYTKEPTGLELSYVKECAEQGELEPPVYVSSYGAPAPSAAIEPSAPSGVRSRESKLKEEKKKSDRNLIREVRSIYESAYGTIDCVHRQVPESSGVNATAANLLAESEHRQTAVESPDTTQFAAPTLYKILAYDPIMQAINFAETTSVVPDASTALTPAEVLLRLSNPSKFFPHFKSLQSQGYEIASGSGDVLVFRKVRDATAKPSSTSDIEPSTSEAARPHRLTNPIDGMQIIPPATGNFASPTGFVNHDLPEPPTEPVFKSGIDVRREEPVFSGRRSEWEEYDHGNSEEKLGRKPKRAFRRFAVGAAWVAACSYAVGVVAEFFRTGGADGKGPVGL